MDIRSIALGGEAATRPIRERIGEELGRALSARIAYRKARPVAKVGMAGWPRKASLVTRVEIAACGGPA